LAVGIAYKPDVADDRESASLHVIKELTERGARVSVYDPVVGDERIRQHGFEPVDPDDDLSAFPLAVILTDHGILDYQALADGVKEVFDTRGVYRRRGIEAPNVIPL